MGNNQSTNLKSDSVKSIEPGSLDEFLVVNAVPKPVPVSPSQKVTQQHLNQSAKIMNEKLLTGNSYSFISSPTSQQDSLTSHNSYSVKTSTTELYLKSITDSVSTISGSSIKSLDFDKELDYPLDEINHNKGNSHGFFVEDDEDEYNRSGFIGYNTQINEIPSIRISRRSSRTSLTSDDDVTEIRNALQSNNSFGIPKPNFTRSNTIDIEDNDDNIVNRPSRAMSNRTVRQTRSLSKVRTEEGEKMINQYLVRFKLGAGSYGKVKLVYNQDDKFLYAMKVFNKSILKKRRIGSAAAGTPFGKGETAFNDVLREIAIMKNMDHPNIVRLYEVIDDPNTNKLYLIMQYCDGGPIIDSDTLQKYLVSVDNPNKGEPLDPIKVRDVFRNVVLGVEYLHHYNIIHRDLKPDNILSTKEGNIVISDFGVSVLYEGDDDMLNRTVGTPAFLAPETCTGAEFRGVATDIWALGVTLFIFVYGCVPYLAKSEPELYDVISSQELKLPEDIEIDIDLKDLLLRMLDKNPKTRITINEIRQHPWVTLWGSMPLPPKDLNVEHKPEELTEMEISKAITNLTKWEKLKKKVKKKASTIGINSPKRY